jgi:hypothetical protein
MFKMIWKLKTTVSFWKKKIFQVILKHLETETSSFLGGGCWCRTHGYYEWEYVVIQNGNTNLQWSLFLLWQVSGDTNFTSGHGFHSTVQWIFVGDITLDITPRLTENWPYGTWKFPDSRWSISCCVVSCSLEDSCSQADHVATSLWGNLLVFVWTPTKFVHAVLSVFAGTKLTKTWPKSQGNANPKGKTKGHRFTYCNRL